MSRLALPVRLAGMVCLCVLLSVSARAQTRAGTADRLVIVGARTTLPPVIESDLAQDRYWVVLGGISPQGEPSGPTAALCGTGSVAFTLSVPDKPGTSPPGDTVGTVTVTWEDLQAWGATEEQEGALSRWQIENTARYCVAVVTPRFADVGSAQSVTARVVRLPNRTAATIATELQRVTADRPGIGGTYAFAPRHIEKGTRLVIVARSVGRRYAYAGTQMLGTFAVLLGTWEPTAGPQLADGTPRGGVRPPTVSECASGRVAFALQVPSAPGHAASRAEVTAVWADSVEAHRLFPRTFAPRTTREVAASQLSSKAVERVAAGWGLPPFACVAEAPVLLGPNVGTHRVVAEVVRPATSPAPTRVEALRQPELIFRNGVTTPPSPGIQVVFDPIRAHARPRPVLGVLAALRGEPRTRATEVADDTTSALPRWAAVMGGFDFALEPVVRLLPRRLAGLRLVLATNITGDPLQTFYTGVSLPSLFSVEATASAVDLSAGVTIDRDGDVLPSLTTTIDLGGTLLGLRALLTP